MTGLEIHNDPAGQQLLTLFKTDRLVPFAEQHMAAVRRLRENYVQSRKETQP